MFTAQIAYSADFFQSQVPRTKRYLLYDRDQDRDSFYFRTTVTVHGLIMFELLHWDSDLLSTHVHVWNRFDLN